MTTAMNDGRQACTGRHRTRVQAAIRTARRDGIRLTAAAVSRAAGVDRTFLYRHRDMLDALHCAEREPAGIGPAGVPAVTVLLCRRTWPTPMPAPLAWLRASGSWKAVSPATWENRRGMLRDPALLRTWPSSKGRSPGWNKPTPS